jgi:hypothetical protein
VRILSLHRGSDTGGQGWRLFNAFRRHSDWTFHVIVRPNAFEYIQYPQDLTWWDAKAEWRRADVVHLHNDFSTARVFEQRGGKKPAVIHYHGSAYRRNPGMVIPEQKRRGAIGVVSTLDLWLLAPDETEWLPSPYDLDWLASLRS